MFDICQRMLTERECQASDLLNCLDVAYYNPLIDERLQLAVDDVRVRLADVYRGVLPLLMLPTSSTAGLFVRRMDKLIDMVCVCSFIVGSGSNTRK